jgi:hypothetical protein
MAISEKAIPQNLATLVLFSFHKKSFVFDDLYLIFLSASYENSP